MSEFPSSQVIRDIASHLRTIPVFIEKDWYVSQVIKAISEIHSDQFHLVFCGGTSLMKGYKVIQRFSEDIDFRILNKNDTPCTRGERRAFRIKVLDQIRQLPNLNIVEESVISRDGSRFFATWIEYPRIFESNIALRQEIKFECTFVENTLAGHTERAITSIANEFMDNDHGTAISCLSLLETCGDKISALMWRVLNRKRGEEGDDNTIVRHLYDLHALSNADMDKKRINIDAREIFNQDKKRGNITMSFDDAFNRLLAILNRDKYYKAEYRDYVLGMCFGREERPTFEQALESLKNYQD